MVFKSAGFRVLFHSSRIPIFWGGGRASNLHFSKHLYLYGMLSFQITHSTTVLTVGLMGQEEPRASQGEERQDWSSSVNYSLYLPLRRRQYTHSALGRPLLVSFQGEEPACRAGAFGRAGLRVRPMRALGLHRPFPLRGSPE